MIKNQKYFAAANSYNGFVSFFREIFNSEEFERIYVIKGGPGTGKSSLMRALAKEHGEKVDEIEEIYCSSDPHSLDGVIIKHENKKIAIIDGTAPHERDAVIPGVKDEIINLGANWDARFLSAYKDDIISLNKEKSKAYLTAYSYLSQAGCIAEFIRGIYKGIFSKNKAKSKADEIFSSISTSKNAFHDIRLLSSFGKYGAYNLSLNCEKIVKVSTDDFYSNILLDCFTDYLVFHNIDFRLFPYALSPKQTDALYIPDAKIGIVKGENPDIISEEYFNSSPYDMERVKTARTIYNIAMEEATRWFNIASDIHFRLEEIYSSAMNFEKNDEILYNKSNEIRNILDLQI